MDTKSEADQVRTFMDDVKKRKRPVQISDFKSFAVAIITELRTQGFHKQTGTNYATNSPNKSQSARPTRSSQAVPPPPRSSNSAGGSISSKAACKHLTDVFHKSFKSFHWASIGNSTLLTFATHFWEKKQENVFKKWKLKWVEPLA